MEQQIETKNQLYTFEQLSAIIETTKNSLNMNFQSNYDLLNDVKDWSIYVSKLHSLTNKEEILNQFSPNTKIKSNIVYIIEYLEKNNIKYEADRTFTYLRIIFPNGKKTVYYGNLIGFNLSGVGNTFKNKFITSNILKKEGYNVAPHFLLLKKKNKDYNENVGLDKACIWCEQNGYPIILKPNKGVQGIGISIINSQNELIKFYNEYNLGNKFNDDILLEKFIEGKEIRVQYLNGKILCAYEKNPLTLYGDGKKSILELLILRQISNKSILKIQEILINKGYNLKDILKIDEQVSVFEFVNNESDEIMEIDLGKDDVNYLKGIANAFGANHMGIDILVDENEFKNNGIKSGTILEINSHPSVGRALSTSQNMRKNYAKIVIDFLSKN